MHQIVLLTALTATSGLFGGGRHCGTGRCGRPTMGYAACATTGYAAPSCGYAAPSCGYGAGSCGYAAPAGYAAPQAVAPAPQAVAPAPQAYAPAPQAAPAVTQTAYYPSYYYPTAPTCANGTCYRR